MKDVLYTPVCCSVCHRTSVFALSAKELQHSLDRGDPVEIRCAFDDNRWKASNDERIRLRRFLIENEVVERSTVVRLRATPWNAATSVPH